jgi:PAS domain S-box-containing protein
VGEFREPDSFARPDDLRILYRLTDSLYRSNTFSEIFDAALEAITAALGSRASILLFDQGDVMRFVAWRGLSDRYRTELEGHSPWLSSDIAPEPICVSNIAASAEPDHVKQMIASEGITALAFIPILSQRRVTGKFMTYYPDEHHFTPDELNLAVSIARQIGFCLERMRAEEALRESEERFRRISEDAPVMLWMSNAEGHCVHLNRLLRTFWGVQNDDLSDFNWATSLHPDDLNDVVKQMQDAAADRKALTIEARYRNCEGAYRLLSTNARPRFSLAGEFLGMIGVNVDVTEHREAEAALRESEERLRIALAAGRMGTWRYDLATGAQWWDKKQYELFGLGESVVPTRSVHVSGAPGGPTHCGVCFLCPGEGLLRLGVPHCSTGWVRPMDHRP